MVIAQIGLSRMAFLSASTWTYAGLGIGSVVAASGNTWLNTSTLVKAIGDAVPLNNVCSFNTFFGFSEGNTTATTHEIIVADQSTSAGNILFRSVASTNTWNSFIKNSDIIVYLSGKLVIST